MVTILSLSNSQGGGEAVVEVVGGGESPFDQRQPAGFAEDAPLVRRAVAGTGLRQAASGERTGAVAISHGALPSCLTPPATGASEGLGSTSPATWIFI